MSRTGRQFKILEIISKYDIDTQEELVDRLKGEGYVATQATISRDIKELSIIKTLSDDGRHYRYAAQKKQETQSSDKYLRIFKNTVLSIKTTENLIVIKTEVGSAGPAAAFIDNLKFPEILGVIAGDDTIFVAVESIYDSENIARKLNDLL